MDQRLQQAEQETQTPRTHESVVEQAVAGELTRIEEAAVEERLGVLRLLEPAADLRLKNRGRLAQALNERERLRLRPRLALFQREVHLTAGTLLLWLAAALAVGAGVAWAIAQWQPAPAATVSVSPSRSGGLA